MASISYPFAGIHVPNPSSPGDSSRGDNMAATVASMAFVPLSTTEISIAVSALKTFLSTSGEDEDVSLTRFVSVVLAEPSRQQFETFNAPESVERVARVVSWSKATNLLRISLVDVIKAQVHSSVVRENVQPPLSSEEYEMCENLLKNYEPFVQALQRRGLDAEHVCVDTWCTGYFDTEDHASRRLAWPAIHVREVQGDNIYGRPVEGINMRIDLQHETVIWFKDEELVPVPPREAYMNFPHPATDYRTELKPLHISQPEGPSFHVTGHTVNWQGWNFTIGFTSHEGLVLHQVKYKDLQSGGEVRSIANRMSFSEMVVPYAGSRMPHYRKNAFDAGEDGFGRNANTLTRGCDCLGWIKYFDFARVDFFGNPLAMERVVCLHEEDSGVLWKHTDWRTDETHVRRSRRLSVSFFTTIGNYDYGFYVYFYQDASIEFEVKLTGILSTGYSHPDAPCPYGQKIAGGLYAPIHQHFFTVRLHMAVDGFKNRVVEVDTVPETQGPHNKYGNSFKVQALVLRSELQGQRVCDSNKSRVWHIQNSDRKARNGAPTSYKLVPTSPVVPLARDDSAIMRRIEFLKYHLTVTRYHPDEMYAGGEFPSQVPGTDGLHRWVLQNRNIADEDLVLWHTFGVSHMPRLEDWPIMPVEHIGFYLKPFNFFAANPALDVAASAPQERCDVNCEDADTRGYTNPKSRL